MMNSSTRSTGILAAGVVIGIVLPPLIRRISNAFTSSKNETTNAVRAGLSSSSIRLKQKALDAFLTKILVAAGCSEENANLVASVLSFADARGIPSHGCNRADTYINEITAGLVDGTANPVVLQSSGCCAVIDGRNALGAVTSRLAMETALKLAKEYGVAVVVCKNSNHYGAAGYWAKMALDKNMIGMSFTNTSPFVVPTGGNTRGVGTNPFCFFAPASDGDSFQLDMASSVVPIGKVEVMDRLEKKVPNGWGVDRNGKNCNDALEIFKFGGLYPLGGSEETAGYKGYGLGMFVEIMSAILSGASVGPDIQSWSVCRTGPIDYGHAFIVIDPRRYTADFEQRLGLYLNRMRGLPGNVKVAGDPEKEFECDAMENGVLLHENVAMTLKSLALRFNVQIPPQFKKLNETKSKASLYDD